jgi:hypothetical protein
MDWREEFRKGHARFRTNGEAIKRAVVNGAILALAFFSPVPIWARLLILIGGFSIVGMIATRKR